MSNCRGSLHTIKPILVTYTSEYINYKNIELYNAGLGTANIYKIIMKKDNDEVDCMTDLFKFGKEIVWDTYWTFSKRDYYLPAGGSMTLLELTSDNLLKQGYNEKEAEKILESWQRQIEGIDLEIHYKDLYNKEMPIYKRTFKS